MLFCNVFVFQLTVLLTLVRDYYYSVAVLWWACLSVCLFSCLSVCKHNRTEQHIWYSQFLCMLRWSCLHFTTVVHLYAYCTDVIRCCCRLQAINSCSPCTVSSLTSTSARVSWPSSFTKYTQFRVNCTSTPSCGTTRVSVGTYATVVTGLRAGTYYQFTVTHDRSRHPRPRYRHSLYETCVATTSLYQSDLYIV